MLSPATASPCVPSSKNGCAAEPRIAVRFAVTARPVLVGLEPGVTATLNSVALPACTDAGLALPTPDGPTVACGVIEKSSTARPSSELGTSMSCHLIQNVAPFGIVNPVMVLAIASRLGA